MKQLTCKETRNNLKILRDYLKYNVAQTNFNMSWYRKTNEDLPTEFWSKNKCGTAGCALGWAPFAEGLEPIEAHFIFAESSESEERSYLNWTAYAEYHFPAIGMDVSPKGKVNEFFNWLFSASWFKTDNSIEGAVARIDYLLENGLPDDYLEQMYGQNPLSYKVEKREPIKIEFVEDVTA